MAHNDKVFMARAIQLAQLNKTAIKTNPQVGAVIVLNNKIIGEGAHNKYGESHAEINAINSVDASNLHLLKQSTIYITLEPCSHFGKTPPCVEKLINLKFQRVVIATLDPSEKVNGKGVQLLKQAGISVTVGCMEKEALQLTKAFRTLALKTRPRIILKFAQSEDGFIGKTESQVWLSNEISKRWVHGLRSKMD